MGEEWVTSITIGCVTASEQTTVSLTITAEECLYSPDCSVTSRVTSIKPATMLQASRPQAPATVCPQPELRRSHHIGLFLPPHFFLLLLSFFSENRDAEETTLPIVPNGYSPIGNVFDVPRSTGYRRRSYLPQRSVVGADVSLARPYACLKLGGIKAHIFSESQSGSCDRVGHDCMPFQMHKI